MNGNPFYEPYWYHGEIQNGSLEHYGVKNMKWGTKNGPPYPLDRGKSGAITKTQKKKKQSFLARLRGDKAKNKKTESKKKSDGDIPRSKKEQEKIRKKALKSTDPKYIYKYRQLLSDNELQDRINRINKEKQIKDLIPKEKNNMGKMDDAVKFLKNVGAMAESTQKIYNLYNTATVQQQNREMVRARNRNERERIEEERRRRREQSSSSS